MTVFVCYDGKKASPVAYNLFGNMESGRKHTIYLLVVCNIPPNRKIERINNPSLNRC